jgi:hypothetical protein
MKSTKATICLVAIFGFIFMDPFTAEVVAKVYLKILRGMSWEDFSAHHKGRISKRAALNVLKSLTPANYDLRPRASSCGMAASISSSEILDLFLDYYAQRLKKAPEELYVKLWWDERVIHGSLQTVGGLSPVWPRIATHNSWKHFIPIFLIGTGCLLPTFELFRLSGINDVMTDLLQSRYDLRHHFADSDCREVATKVIIVMVVDWMCYYKISSDCHGPSSVSGALKLCPCCEFDVMDKIGAWRNNPWYWWTRSATRSQFLVLTFLTLPYCLYDPMHGLARLCNALFEGLYLFLQLHRLYGIITRIAAISPTFATKAGKCNIKTAKLLSESGAEWEEMCQAVE